MSASGMKKESTDIPLYFFGLLCFFTIFMCQTRLSITKESCREITPWKHQQKWMMWNKKSNIYGFFLKAVVLITSPFVSLTSTGVLLAGIWKQNLYLFLPWLCVTFRGLISVQSQNLMEIFDSFLENRFTVNGQWRTFSLYLIVIIIDVTEWFCFQEVFRMFRVMLMDEPKGDFEGRKAEVDAESDKSSMETPPIEGESVD